MLHTESSTSGSTDNKQEQEGVMRHLLSIYDLSIDEIMSLTNSVEDTQPTQEKLRGTLAFLFAQVSLRTMSSFAAAGTRIGLAPIQVSSTGGELKDHSDLHDELVQLSLTSTTSMRRRRTRWRSASSACRLWRRRCSSRS